MLNIHLFNRYVVFSSRMSRIIKFLLATFLVAGLSVAGMSITRAFSRTNNKINLVQPAELRPLTITVDNTQQSLRPGHDFGAIYGSTTLSSSSQIEAPLLAYWVNGQMVVRRSELGPLTGTVDEPLPKLGPGHDFGAIYGAVDASISLSSSQPKLPYSYNGRR